MRRAAVVGFLALFLAPAAVAQAPDDRTAEAAGVAWSASGEARLRYETLEGQFRAGGGGGDQILTMRSIARVEASAERIVLGAEIMDARAYLDDAGTPLSTSFVNPLDVLQAYARLRLGASELTLGRFTLNIGSGRFVARNSYRNTITSFMGAAWSMERPEGHVLQAFYTVPTERRPLDRVDLDDNALEADGADEGRRLWGVRYDRKDVSPALLSGFDAELFVFGFDEEDRSDAPTPDRRYRDVGARLYRAPALGAWDADLEGAWRFGERHATADPSDAVGLDVSAGLLHVSVGYTFDRPWRPRLAFDLDAATGDGNDADDAFGRYESLFGARRGDFGNTSLIGPLSRANIVAPGGRLELAPEGRWDARVGYRAAFLADERDVWDAAGVRDPAGESGRFVGHLIDSRARVWLEPQELQLELGATALLKGRFAEDAPNAADAGDTLYGFIQLTAFF